MNEPASTDVSLLPTRVGRGFMTRLRSRIMAGLVLVIPIWLTVVVVTFVFRLMRNASLWLVEALLMSPAGEPILARWGLSAERLTEQGLAALPTIVQWGVSVFSVLLTVVLLYVLGVVTANVVGKRIVGLAEYVLNRVPLVPVIYQASKKVLETIAGEGTRPFQQVVLAPFPTTQTKSVGFVTRVIRDRATAETLYTVFVPTAPNPTTGFVFVIKPADVIELDWSIEEAMKAIMSGGVLMPDHVPLEPTSSLASHDAPSLANPVGTN